jgi:hypothetical protein
MAPRSIPVLFALLVLVNGLQAGGDSRGIDFFEKKIRPVLVEHCSSCHSKDAQAKKKLRGGLLVDSRAALLKGGDSGPAVVPGKAQESLLIKALQYSDEIRMPPKKRLPDSVVADFVTWVNLGAPAPEDSTAKGPASSAGMSVEEGRKFWAYQLPRKAPPPVVQNTAWPGNDVDRFILAQLEARGLRPAPDADRAVLARRLYYDLIGLPPTPEEVDAFVQDSSADAYEKLVDRLLASPAYGERWGRHWLDVARYAESLTLRGFVMKEAWRYRDYVIDSFNADVPFDRFIQEQVAGDLLPAATPAQRGRQLIATTFLVLGNTNLEEQDKKQLRMDVVDEQLETICRAFLAQTIGCACCHDHKFDPIPTRDYYALAGILRNARTLEHANVSRWLEVPLPVGPEREAVLKKHEEAVAALQMRIKAGRSGSAGASPSPAALKKLEDELKKLEASGPKRPMTMTVLEEKEIADTQVHIRGSVHNLGEKVPRGFLQVATYGSKRAMPANESGRRQFAAWLAAADNPLTARVVVNRAWHWLCGAGLVRTTDNFGTTGEQPSHPELLDYLAVQFVEEGWSMKKLVRQIVLSHTYRLSTAASPSPDPENRLYARMNRRRLDAECIRDTVLAVSGQLILDRGGPTFKADLAADYGFRYSEPRRSVYAPVFRNALPQLFEVFDFADPSVTTGRRNVSTVAPQALFLMNHPFILEQARFAAGRILARKDLDEAGRIDRAYRLALGRPPSAAEQRLAQSFLKSQSADSLKAWAMFYQALFGSLDFRYVN